MTMIYTYVHVMKIHIYIYIYIYIYVRTYIHFIKMLLAAFEYAQGVAIRHSTLAAAPHLCTLA